MSHGITPVTPPLFGLGCAIYVSLTPAPVILGPVSVLGGNAQLNVPIPLGLPPGDIALQWLESAHPIVFPVGLSDGGRARIYN